jgi:soluble lytic murein transglycosylase-like protein
MTLEFRPHHFLCTVGFEGKGYSDEFVREFQAIADRLRREPDGDSVKIRVVPQTDSICGPCPNRRETKCTSEDKIQALDRNHAAVLGLKPGDELTWGEAKRLLARKMTPAAFDSACEPCGWKPLGICRTALMKLQAETKIDTKGAVTLPALAAVSLASLGLLLAGAEGLAAVRKARPAQRRPASSSAVVKKTLKAEAKDDAEPKASAKSGEGATEAKDTNAPRTIDELRDELFKKQKSKKARAVADALEALRKEKYPEARRLAQALQSDDLFGDYGYALAAAGYRGEGMDLNQKKRWAGAQKTAEQALSLYIQIEQKFPGSSFIKKLPEELGRTEAVLAESFHGRKMWKQAQDYYERTFQRLSSSNSLLGMVRPESLGRYAEACAKQAPKKKPISPSCAAWINRFVMLHPKGSEELKAIVKFLPGADEKAQPPRIESRLTQAYKAPDFDIQAFDEAMALYSDGKYGDAINGFQKFLDEYPRSAHRFRTRYWLAQALTQKQDHEKAQKLYEELIAESPLSFYGLMASVASGKSLDPYVVATLPNAVATDPFLYPAEAQRLRRAERFVAEGVKDLAVQDLRELRARDSLSSPFLMYLAMLNSEAGNHNQSFSLLSELIQRGYEGVFSTYGLRLIFPVEYWSIIQKHAERNKLDPILVLSLIKQESAFDNQAISGSGASGLMQLMPGTAVDTESTVKRADLVETEANIRVGTKYLKKLLSRYNGNIAMSLAGYNAGPNAVDRWVREGRAKKGVLEFVEAIPYRETREYVAAIIRNHFWYSRALAPEAPKPVSYFWSTTPPPAPENPVELPSPTPPREVKNNPLKAPKKRRTI